jgi:phenylalanyl-tRNA synthetase beta chain
MVTGIMGGPRLARSWLSGDEALGFFDAKAVVGTLLERLRAEAFFEHTTDPNLSPGRTAAVVAAGQRVGVIGDVHPRTAALFGIAREPVVLFEIDVHKLLPLVATDFRYRPIPRYPEIIRDLALVVKADASAADVEATIRSFPLVSKVALFDVYAGDKIPPGTKSLAFSVRFQSPERTLTDEEVDRTQQKIIERLRHELGAELRQ